MPSFSFNIRKPTASGNLGTVLHKVSGHTTQSMTKGKPVNIDLMTDNYKKMAYRLIHEKQCLVEKHNNYTYRDTHFKNRTMDVWYEEGKQLDIEYNWKLRVLSELSNNEKDAQLLLDFAAKAKENYEKEYWTPNRKRTINVVQPRRTSQRIRDRQTKQK